MKSFGKISKGLKIKAVVLVILTTSFFSFSSFVNNYFEISKNLEIFASIYKEVNTYYVDEVDPGKLVRTAIDQMLETLDPYTNYISEAEAEDYRFQMTGQYGGIGATIGSRKDMLYIEDTYEGYPTQKQDIRIGDMLLEIDGKNIKGKNNSEVSKLLKGQAGTKVKLKLQRNSEILEKEIIREEIKVKNVPYYGMINDNTGYIKLTGFTNDAGKEVRDALINLKKNPKMNSLVLDLRGNPGGLLHEAVNIVNVFIPQGQEVVSTKGKVKEWDRAYNTLNQPVDLTIPLVVIVDERSASASEIVSGTLQDLDRAVVVGKRTFGKGLVQSTRPLSYNSQLKVTTAKYYTPSGRCIQALDYSKRNEKGEVGKVPDSLRKEFKTKNGRSVFDGQGVTPDVVNQKKEESKIAHSLDKRNYLIFDYATIYRNKHGIIADPKEFKLTDEDFNDFVKWLSDKEYGYETNTELALEDLRKKATEENYVSALNKQLEDLKLALKHDKQADLQKHKQEIIELLETEITRRYFFQKARIESTFDDDQDIAASVKLFADLNQYKQILTVKK